MQLEHRAQRHDGAQPVGRFRHRHTHPALPLTHIKLGRFAGLVPQGVQRSLGGLGQWQGQRGGPAEGDQGQTGQITMLGIATEQAVGDEGSGQTMGGRPGQTRRFDQLVEGTGPAPTAASRATALSTTPTPDTLPSTGRNSVS